MEFKGNFQCKKCDYRTDSRRSIGIHLAKTHKIGREINEDYFITVPVKAEAVPHLDMEKVERVVNGQSENRGIPISDTTVTQYDIELVELALPSMMKICQFMENFKNFMKKG